MAYVPNSNSVVAFQSDPTKLVGTVSVVSNVPQSVSGVGIFNVNQIGNGSIIAAARYNTTKPTITDGDRNELQLTSRGALNTTLFANDTATAISAEADNADGVAESATANNLSGVSRMTMYNGSNQWDRVRGTTAGGLFVQVTGSVAAISGGTTGNSSVLVVGTMPPQSVSGVGTFNIDPQGSGSIIAKLINSSVTAYQGVTPWAIGNSSVQVQNIATGQSSVYLIPGVGVLGSVAALQGTNPWVVGNSSVQVNNILTGQSSVYLIPGVGVLGSVATLQGTDPWRVIIPGSVITVWKDSSVLTALTSSNASIIGILQGTSIVGTYAEDAAHADGNKGLFVLGVRNDLVASFASADLDYTPHASDSAGRTLTKPFAPVESSFVATASTVNAGFGTNQAASVRVLAAPGAGLKWYVTDMNVSNTGSVATLVTLTDDSSNTLWKGIAPAGGGTNMPGLNTPIVSANANTPLGLISGTASSIVHMWVAGFKAP